MKTSTVEKVFYYLGEISIPLTLIFVILLLPLILKSSWCGIVLLVTLVIFLITRLYFSFPKNRSLFKVPLYNSMLIFITIYTILVYYRLESALSNNNVLLRDINLKYCEANFLIMACAFLGASMNSFIYKFNEK